MFELIRERRFTQKLSNEGYSQAYPRLNFCFGIEARAGPWYSTLMPRRLKNNPLGVSDTPKYVTDPALEAEILKEFVRKRTFIVRSFKNCHHIEQQYGTIEQSIRRMKNAVARERGSKQKQRRLHPALEAAISHHAGKFAAERANDELRNVIQADINKAAHILAETLTVKQGPKKHIMLRHHVEGFMALVQETTGKPVTSQRTKYFDYEPHLPNLNARQIFELLHTVDPGITVTKVANMIREARVAYTGKPMRFVDFFPAYGAKRNDNGTIEYALPHKFEPIGVIFPIYCT